MGAAKLIAKEQIRTIYALGASLGILERGNKADELHALVDALTGSSSVSRLTEAQGRTVIAELRRRASDAPQSRRKPKQHPTTPGGVTEGQQRKIWKLMYLLAKVSPSGAAIGERLCGVIHKELGVDTVPLDPFRWMDYQQGGRLIESLKKYVSHAGGTGKEGGNGGGAAGDAGTTPAGGPEG